MSRKSTNITVRTPVKLVSYVKVPEVHARCTMKSKASLLALISVLPSFAGRDGVKCFIWSMMEAWKDKSLPPALAEAAQLWASGNLIELVRV